MTYSSVNDLDVLLRSRAIVILIPTKSGEGSACWFINRNSSSFPRSAWERWLSPNYPVLMRPTTFVLVLILFLVPGIIPAQRNQPSINLAGQWNFSLDSADAGLAHRWFAKQLRGTIPLPGSIAQNGKGYDVSVDTKWTGGIVNRSWYTDAKYSQYRKPGNVKVPFWLNPVKVYVGPAWYQKDVDVPKQWQGKHIELFLERCHWETTLWVDDKEIGTNTSLSTPHVYDLTTALTAGRHRITLRVDNRIKDIDVGRNAHSVSDHTQTNWNGIVGKIELRAISKLHISDVTVVPDLSTKSVKVRVSLVNQTGKPQSGFLDMTVNHVGKMKRQVGEKRRIAYMIEGEKGSVEGLYSMGDSLQLWDEFQPNLYQLRAELNSTSVIADRRSVQFGMRDFKVEGTRFAVNGRPIFLRGTLECAIFPKTGYASMEFKEWRRIFRICKSYGLNHVRFHSWCPPEAAFDAADQEGIYLYVECCAWTTVGDGKPIDIWLFEESERIVSQYGNHPSFCMMSYGNEPSGKNQSEYLGKFVNYWKAKDSRRVYTSGAGWPLIAESDFHITDKPRIQVWGMGLNSLINKEAPSTDFDFRTIISKYDKPVVSHEIGQWCAYPNFKEITKYTGVLKAKNFEIFRESLRGNHMGDQANDFLMASGKLQVLCYKADIEAALRTPGMAGFELLDLHDFPGQGTALVGVLDPFWQEKGYVTAKEYSRFCNSTVPLARLKKRVFLNNEEFAAEIEVAHFGATVLKQGVLAWRVRGAAGTIIASGSMEAVDIPISNSFSIGAVHVPLAQCLSAGKMNLEVSIGGFTNDWDFWVYPAELPKVIDGDIVVASEINGDVERALAAGKSVLLLPDTSSINSTVPPGFSSIFWNTAWTSGQPPHTLGVLCYPQHPALKSFPTEYHSNWQWWDLVTHSRPMILDSLPASIRPVVQVVDDWVTNRKLALVFEAKVGAGKILICSVDMTKDFDRRPPSAQLLYSLEKYIGSRDFAPKQRVAFAELKKVFKLPAVSRQ
jgi:hypothetical protein